MKLSSLLPLVIALPAFAMLAFNYEDETKVEVYGIKTASVKSVMLPKKFKNEEVCLAENIYFEARGESHKGQVAVANATMNRVGSDSFPSSICKVVYQPNQFSWTRKKEIIIEEPEAYQKAELIASKALAQQLPKVVGTADHYYAEWVDPPEWSKKMKYVGKVGQHLYFDSNQKPVKNDGRPTKAIPKSNPKTVTASNNKSISNTKPNKSI